MSKLINNYSNNKIMSIVVAVCLILILSVPTNKVSANTGLFTVKPILPSNQVEGIENYISVNSENKGFEETLQFEITNHSDEDIELQAKAVNAMTAPTGSIQYTAETEIDNAALTADIYQFTDYVPNMENFSVPANKTVVMEVPVNIPLTNGDILGGISFGTVSEQKQSSNENIEIIVNNELNTIIAVQINFGNVNESVAFALSNTYFEQLPSMYAIRFPIDYTGNQVLTGTNLTYVILDSNENAVFEGTTNLTLAPKSAFNLLIPWQSSTLDLNETYTFMGTIVPPEGNPHSFNQKISNKPTEALTVTGTNNVEVTEESTLNKKLVYAIAIGIALLLLSMFFVIISKKKKQEEQQDDEEFIEDAVE